MITSKQVFVLEDGRTFDSREEAEAAERVALFRDECFKLLAQHSSIIDDQHVVDFLDTNSSELLVLLMNLHKVTAG